MAFYKYLKSHSVKNPNSAAIIEGDCIISYKEFCKQIESFASAISELPLHPKSKVGLLCLNQKEYLIALFGCLLKGIPVIPYNFLLKPEDLVFITKDASIDILIIDSAFVKPEIIPFFNFFPNKILVGSAEPNQVGEGRTSCQTKEGPWVS